MDFRLSIPRTPRQQLQMAYELAFQPARLNAVWNEWEQQRIPDPSALRAVVEWALMLHQWLRKCRPGWCGTFPCPCWGERPSPRPTDRWPDVNLKLAQERRPNKPRRSCQHTKRPLSDRQGQCPAAEDLSERLARLPLYPDPAGDARACVIEAVAVFRS